MMPIITPWLSRCYRYIAEWWLFAYVNQLKRSAVPEYGLNVTTESTGVGYVP